MLVDGIRWLQSTFITTTTTTLCLLSFLFSIFKRRPCLAHSFFFPFFSLLRSLSLLFPPNVSLQLKWVWWLLLLSHSHSLFLRNEEEGKKQEVFWSSSSSSGKEEILSLFSSLFPPAQRGRLTETRKRNCVVTERYARLEPSAA